MSNTITGRINVHKLVSQRKPNFQFTKLLKLYYAFNTVLGFKIMQKIDLIIINYRQLFKELSYGLKNSLMLTQGKRN